MRSLLLLLALTGTAAAEGRRTVVITPPEAFTPQPALISPYLYLNRCRGGCTVIGGNTNDATAQESSIPEPGTYTIGEFASSDGETGAAADEEWAAVVQCMKEVYSPYGVTVTDTPPTGGVGYTEAIIAGQPGDIGQAGDVLGIAPLASDCSPQSNVISFSFANHHGAADRVNNICWTAAQESAHAFGLDHEYEFLDGTSACSDPMTYRVDCGGEKFFRDRTARCGEDTARPCRCGATQNSHQKLLSVFGPGAPITAAPTVAILTPHDGDAVTASSVVHPQAGAQRGVARLELWINGSKWSEQGGAAFGPRGQPDPYNYTMPLPGGLPDSILDLVVKAYDDLGVETDSTQVTVLKGAACSDTSSCLAEQKCDDGRCHWDAPTGELGDACDYAQFCKSYLCLDTGGGKTCTQECSPDAPASCPDGYVCATDGARSVCAVAGAGCCSVGGAGGGPAWLAAGVLAMVLRRRRR